MPAPKRKNPTQQTRLTIMAKNRACPNAQSQTFSNSTRIAASMASTEKQETDLYLYHCS
jgi:hypothetical protein